MWRSVRSPLKPKAYKMTLGDNSRVGICDAGGIPYEVQEHMPEKRTRVTLVYPGIAGYGFGSLGQGMDAGWVSHGLAHISSAAKAEGFHVDLIDLRALKGWEEFEAEIAARRPDVIGVTMMSVDFNPANEAIRRAKAVLPELVAVVGGPHPTVAVEEVAANPAIDYIVLGEGRSPSPGC
jgi:radical SAM superfamily enzyme YgiQ (UPF0313 family)